jgi:twitching motility protein PilT
MDIYEFIAVSVKQNASDLHLSAANLPMLRINGKLIRCANEALAAEALERQLLQTLTESQKLRFNAAHQLDYSLTVNGCRLRGNLFRQRQGIAAAFRHIPQHIPSLRSLTPPSGLEKLSAVENGLILFTGPTGCGKSTTLAALLQHIAQNEERHIVTLEDPIEFIHTSGRSLIQQREVGIHVDSFQQGLYAALRQDPDVILLGELRDLPTISLALTAAETGSFGAGVAAYPLCCPKR